MSVRGLQESDDTVKGQWKTSTKVCKGRTGVVAAPGLSIRTSASHPLV